MTTVPPCGRGGVSGRGLGVTECPAMRNPSLFASHSGANGLKRGSHNAVCQCAWFGIFSPRVDDGKWLVRAIFMARNFE